MAQVKKDLEFKSKGLEFKINVDTSEVEAALNRIKKITEDVSKTAIEITVKQVEEKKWWEFWK